jgi:predicted GTPase
VSTVALSLISHTNVGKTTLARTLLRRDIGEVRDASHVTLQSERHLLLDTDAGDSLELWDTPGFGDSVRLLRRLEQSANPVGWLLSQVWDRFADRAFFSSQQAARNVRDHADVVLYLVNATEDPLATAYVEPEMRILEWIGKPVLVLINQLGPPDPLREAADVAHWRERLATQTIVRGVLACDAFARCWIHEHVLLDQVVDVVAVEQRASAGRLAAAWRERNRRVFDGSMSALARQLAATAVDQQAVPATSLGATVRAWLRGLVRDAGAGDGPSRVAMGELAARLDQRVVAATDELIALHGLSGRASAEVLERLRGDYDVDLAIDPGKATLIGAAISGTLGGLAADLAAGGLTLGAGAILGTLLGAAGSRGLARAYNTSRGTEGSFVRWSTSFLDARLVAAVLRYLAVAHFGRGRGDYVDADSPARWRELVTSAAAAHARQTAACWALAQRDPAVAVSADAIAAELQPIVGAVALDVLDRLYPGASERAGPAAPRASPDHDDAPAAVDTQTAAGRT